MPEIGEVARVVHYIRKHLVGKTLATVNTVADENVYGKVGTSAAEFQKAIQGKQVVEAGQQGKYFWMIMSSPPHPVMHFGMAGWLKIRSEDTYYYKPKKGAEKEEWPPKYWKFILETQEEPKVEAAFVDLRRFGRIRLVDCEADQIRNVTPLKENGPDPVIDKDIVTVDWVKEKCRAKKVPIKALLLDQANISGIGNWVGDEIMYNARIHPEQYSNSLSDDQIKQLHKSIHYICGTAVSLLADSDQFPEDWLFKHRWNKGKKDAPGVLPTGEKIVFLTVGGRTSAVIPSIQKKTGPVAKEISEGESEAETKPKTNGKAVGKKRKSQADELEGVELKEVNATDVNDMSTPKKARKTKFKEVDVTDVNDMSTPKKARKSKFKEELDEEAPVKMTPVAKGKKRKSDVETQPSTKKKGKAETPGKEKPTVKPRKKDAKLAEDSGRRRSARLA